MFDRNALAYIIQQKNHKMLFYSSIVLLIRCKSKTWTLRDALKLAMPVNDTFMLQDRVSDCYYICKPVKFPQAVTLVDLFC